MNDVLNKIIRKTSNIKTEWEKQGPDHCMVCSHICKCIENFYTCP